MNHPNFVGRRKELIRLEGMLWAKTARLIVIKGRRRIGKSRLIAELIEGKPNYHFVGMAPDKNTTAQSQRDHFAFQLHQQTGLPELKTDDWRKLFALLHERTQTGKVILVFDEITWMGSKDSDFLGKLHYAWEEYFKKNNNLILILCGSVSAWIEKNIASSTGYFGRISLKMTLDELPINQCNTLIENTGFKGSAYEKLMLLSVMGGIPWYLEQTDPGLSAIENIKNLCFTKDALLVEEFNYIFNDLFNEKRRDTQKKIVSTLKNSHLEYDQIAETLGYSKSGALSDYLQELILSGFVSRDFSWSIKTGHPSPKISRYRLRDNYLRFYLKYIQPKLNQIEQAKYLDVDVSTLPGWDSMVGLQFENLILNNRRELYEILNINPVNIVHDDPFYQRATSKQQACQIDYLIQTKFKTLYVFEFKFSRNTIGASVITSVQEKLKRLKLPKGYACIPVLIHVNEVSSDVTDQDYFNHIVNICDWFE